MIAVRATSSHIGERPMRHAGRLGVHHRGFFGKHIAANTSCELDASSLRLGDTLAVTLVTLAAPLQPSTAPSEVRLFCNGVVICTLSQRVPNLRLQLTVSTKMSVECVGPKGSGGVDLTGYTYVNADRRTEDEEPEERRTEAEWLELQRGRKRRVEELRREAAAEAATVRSTAPARTPRLTFNPQVRVAEYVPKLPASGSISPLRTHESLEEMVARREAIKKRQALSAVDGDEDDEEQDDGAVLQAVLAELLVCSVSKLRVICKANGLDSQGKRGALIERLVDHIAADLREARAEGGESDSETQ